MDTCLLGNCDDVSNALVKEMNRGINGKSNKERVSATDGNDETTYRMLCNVQEEYRGADGTIRGLHRHPPCRVFLFPGAAIPKEGEGSGTAGDSDADLSYREVAQCDGCQQQIEEEIMKCQQCFDFDLCKKCFNSGKVTKTHFEGKHTFVREYM